MNIGIEEIFSINIIELLIRFALNLLVGLLLMRYLYFKSSKKEEYVFSFLLISSTIFLLIYLLSTVQLQIGLALGLFAIFGIIRYRTNPIPVKEMTYLFAIIGLAVINAISHSNISILELITSNTLILLLVFVLEHFWLSKQLSSKKIIFDKIELITPDRREELQKDLEQRTGLNIIKLELGDINLLNDTINIQIYFRSET